MAGQPQQSAQIQQHMSMEDVLKIVGTMAAEMKKPYIDAEKQLRENRDRARTKEQERQRLAMRKHVQENCSHKDANEKWIISLVHNYPDNQTRGFCNECKVLIEPEHIEIGFDQKPIRVSAHPLYNVVTKLEFANRTPAL